MALLFALSDVLGRWGLTPTVLALTRPVSGRRHLERAAAAPILRVPAVPARHGRRAADHDRPRPREHRQRGVQLDPDLRAPRRAGDGRPRIGVGDGACARHDGGACCSRSSCSASADGGRVCSRRRREIERAWMRRLIGLGFAGGDADHARGRSLRRGDRAGGPPLRRRARGTPDRGQHRGVHVHGAARSRRRPAAVRVGQAVGTARSSRRGASGLDGAALRLRLHGVRRRGLPAAAGSCSSARSPHDPPRPRGRRVAADVSPRSSSCSTACRQWRPARCADLAIRVRRCSGTSRATGSSACRSATSCASPPASASIGLWWGLSSGLIICGVALLWAGPDGSTRRLASPALPRRRWPSRRGERDFGKSRAAERRSVRRVRARRSSEGRIVRAAAARTPTASCVR